MQIAFKKQIVSQASTIFFKRFTISLKHLIHLKKNYESWMI